MPGSRSSAFLHGRRRLGPPGRLVAALAAASILGPILPAAAPDGPLPAPPVAASVTTPYASTGGWPVAPATVHDRGGMTTSSGIQSVRLVEVDPADPQITIEASLSNDRVVGLERTTAQAIRRSREGHRVVAAINGDVWSGYTSSTLHAPTGIHVQDGELMVAGPVGHATVGFGADDRAITGSPRAAATVTTATGATFAPSRVNQARRAGELVLYTPRFGASTGTDATGVEVVLAMTGLPLAASGTWAGTVQAVRSAAGSTPLAAGTVVLSGAGAGATGLAALVPGTAVSLATTIDAGWEGVRHAISGREWIVRAGATSISPRPATADQVHPRSAVGVTADGRVILAGVDGRQPGWSVGVTLPELAQLMLDRGAVSAINLDGGGSTVVAARRPGDGDVSIVNRPSDGSERAVTNSLLVVSTAPTGPLARLDIRPDGGEVFQGTTVDYSARGQDAAWNPVPIDPADIGWQLDGSVGTLDAAGRLRATETGTATVTATVAEVAASETVTVVPDTSPPVATAPRARFISGSNVRATSVTMTVSWSAADLGLGVASYELRQSVDGAPWVAVALPSPTSTSVRRSLALGHSHRFQVRAVDRAGNVGAWVSAAAFRLRAFQETISAIRYSSGWTRVAWSGYHGGAGKYHRTRGATARFTFTGSQVGWVAPLSAGRGSARVYVDGVYQRTVSLYRSTTATARVVYAHAWSATGRHTLEIRVVGTAGRPRVDVDAFLLVDPPRPDPVLVGAGDIASCAMSGDSATAKLLDTIQGTVFTAGDNAYEQGTAAQFSDCYAPTWGRHRSRTRPSPGNHDYGTTGAAGYFGYFGSRAGSAGQGWYAYDLGAWRVYALNSNCALVSGCEAGSPQETWLRTDLAANPRRCVVAYFHHPLFSSGSHGNDPRMGDIWQALHEAGADVIVSGHDHDYERFAPQAPDGTADPAGIREFVVGTGGAGLRSFGTVRPNSEVRSSSAHGVLKLTLRPTSYSWKFVPVAGKTFTDSGSALCH